MNAFQLEHADLGHRAAWRGKSTDLTASPNTLWHGMISATGFFAMA
jgi:hypothetical protein